MADSRPDDDGGSANASQFVSTTVTVVGVEHHTATVSPLSATHAHSCGDASIYSGWGDTHHVPIHTPCCARCAARDSVSSTPQHVAHCAATSVALVPAEGTDAALVSTVPSSGHSGSFSQPSSPGATSTSSRPRSIPCTRHTCARWRRLTRDRNLSLTPTHSSQGDASCAAPPCPPHGVVGSNFRTPSWASMQAALTKEEISQAQCRSRLGDR